MDWRRGTAEGNRRIIYEIIGILAVLIVIAIFVAYFLNAQFQPEAINTAKAITFAASCTSLINIHPGDAPQEIQDAWEGPATPDIDKSCSTATDKVTFGQVEVTCDSLDTDDGTCEVRNFALPQEEAGESYWRKFIAGMGDPKYLLYYEAFPQGPSNRWEPLPENTLAITEAVVGGAINVMFLGAGRVAKSLPLHKLFSRGDEVAEVGKFHRVRKMMSYVRRGASGGDQTADDLARQAMGASIGRRLSDDQVDALSQSQVRSLTDDLLEYQKNPNNNLIRREGDEIAEEINDDILGPHLDDAGVSMGDDAQQQLSRELARMLHGADEVAENYGVAARFTPEEYWRQINTVNSVADDVMEEASEGAGRQIARDKLEQVAKSAREGIDGIRSLPRRARDFTWEDLKRKSLFLACRSKAVRYATVQNADEVFQDNDELEALTQTAGLTAGASKSICSKRILGSVAYKWTAGTRQKYYNAVLAVAYVGEKRESISRKYNPDGINTVVLKRPFQWLLPGHERRFRLNRYSNYYYMSLHRSDFLQGDRRRFYLVSPLWGQDTGSDDPHITVEHEQIQCKDIDASDTKGTYWLHTQPEWNGGERMDPPETNPQGGDSSWDNRVLVRNPTDPNTDLTPGESGLSCQETSEDNSCDGLGISACRDAPGCSPQGAGTYYTGCTGTPPSCDQFQFESQEDECEATPGCTAQRENPDVPTVISREGNGIKECKPPGFVDEFTNIAPWVDNQEPLETVQVSLNDMGWSETEDGKPNYGYDGADHKQTFMSAGVMGGILVVDIIIEGATGGLGTGVALFITGATYSFVNDEIERTALWPEH